MRLKALKLRDFRCYQGDVTIPFCDLTTLVGRNDLGKSAVLDALAIFFDSPLVRLDSSDLCVHTEQTEIRIGCVFTDLPSTLVLDATSQTTLKDEYLLNKDGDLEICRVHSCEGGRVREKVIAVAKHPTAKNAEGLLQAKNAELKRQVDNLKIEAEGLDRRSNPSLRKAIWKSISDLELEEVEIELNKEDAKTIWQQLQNELPTFALFRADRPSTDEDAEVQDPMKLAVKKAVEELKKELDKIKEEVRQKTLDVAQRTVEKLAEFDDSLAGELKPTFRVEPKWDSIFKLSLTGDDEIPINKRGSGVRRLVLFSFFRAEAERQRAESGRADIIYAVEEPETSQHPYSQRLVIEALRDLATQDGCQVVLTTHVPALAGLVPVDSVRYVCRRDDGRIDVQLGSDEVLRTVADDLGVLPDKRVQLFVCVEGPNDVVFLRHMNRLVRQAKPGLPNVGTDPRIVVLPLGGSTLQDWVNEQYLKNIGLPEFHIYDRNEQAKYQSAVDEVNMRSDGSLAIFTTKREMENYLHPDAIKQVLGVTVTVTDTCDVEQCVENALGKKRINRRSIKRWLNDDAAATMTVDMLRQRGAFNELVDWLTEIGRLLR